MTVLSVRNFLWVFVKLSIISSLKKGKKSLIETKPKNYLLFEDQRFFFHKKPLVVLLYSVIDIFPSVGINTKLWNFYFLFAFFVRLNMSLY
jgi:hypothetical protein